MQLLKQLKANHFNITSERDKMFKVFLPKNISTAVSFWSSKGL